MSAQAQPRFKRLLLIDDEPGIRRMMSLDLSAAGYQVSAAEDGESGLEMFEAQQPDIVLTDLKMPGLDGIQVLRRIKSASPQTEVIVITGHGDIDLAIQSLQLEASDFITKPIKDQALYVALKRAQERLAMRQELAAYTANLEQRVAEATKKVVASERLAAVGQTVSSLVHSLKNMLAGLRGGSYMIKEGMDTHSPEMLEAGYSMLGRNLRRVKGLVDDLLTISKPRTPELAPQNLLELASDAFDCMAQEAADKDVQLNLDRANAQLCTLMDREAVLQALLNLISNAIDAAAQCSQGKVEVGVGGDESRVWFQVSDNGPGLDQEACEHIFQGFFSTKGAAGTGLGLMVSQKTAKEHGGLVEFDNQPGQGATFRLALPRGRPQAEGQQAQA